MAKFHGKIEDEEPIIFKKLNSSTFEPNCKSLTAEKSTEINFKSLSKLKSRDGKWREIFETIRNRDKIDKCNKKFKCVEEKEIKEDPPRYSTYESNDKREQKVILIQRILKARASQIEMMKQVEINRNLIQKYRTKFQIKCLEGIVPKITPEPSKVQICEPKKDRTKTKILEPKVSQFFDMKIDDAIYSYSIVQAKHVENLTLLKEAEKIRKLRRSIMEKQEKIAEMRQKRSDEIKSKLDELYDQMTMEIIEKIKPIAIEMIAQEDAQKFIVTKAKEIDNSEKVSTTDSEIDEEVEKAFNEVLIPHVMKIIEEKDEEMHALIASCDAFEELLKFMCEKKEEEK
jgi:hypothetical protein